METAEERAVREERESVIVEMEAEEQGTHLPGSRKDDGAAQRREEQQPIVEDPWGGVNPALKKMFNDMEQRVASVSITEQRLKQAESRIGAISNELHAAKEAAKTVQVSPTKEQMAAAVESDEKWESLKRDFPEWADAFESKLVKAIAPSLADIAALKADLQGLKAQGADTEKTAADVSTAVESRMLTFFKPKWKETIATKEWQEWLAIQPPEKAALVKSDLASDAITLLDAFEETRQPQKTATEIAQERRKRLNTGDLPTGRKAAPVKSEADMNASELRANIGKEVFAES